MHFRTMTPLWALIGGSFMTLLALSACAVDGEANSSQEAIPDETVEEEGASRESWIMLTFRGVEYHHRWSSGDQHEFTPSGQEDLNAWQDMLTIVEHPAVQTGDQLAEVANGILGNYQSAGEILRTDSKPRTENAEAEHFMSVMFATPEVAETAFSRVLLADGRGVVVVSSRRFYGEGAATELGAWIEANGAEVESALWEFDNIPATETLQALPQAEG